MTGMAASRWLLVRVLFGALRRRFVRIALRSSALATMPSVSEDVHQRASQDEQERQQLQEVGVVTEEHPGYSGN